MINKEEDLAIDLGGEPTHVCVCGSRVWNLQVMFEDYEIGMYFTDMECALCGSKATAPTLPDKPGWFRGVE